MAKRQKKILNAGQQAREDLIKQVLGIANVEIQEAMRVPARVRVHNIERQRDWSDWQDVQIYIQGYQGHIVGLTVAPEYFEWAEYTLDDDLNEKEMVFSSEEWFMQIDCPHRTPDNLLEEQAAIEKEAMLDFVTTTLNAVTQPQTTQQPQLQWIENYNVHTLHVTTLEVVVYWDKSGYKASVNSVKGTRSIKQLFADPEAAKQAALKLALRLAAKTIAEIESALTPDPDI